MPPPLAKLSCFGFAPFGLVVVVFTFAPPAPVVAVAAASSFAVASLRNEFKNEVEYFAATPGSMLNRLPPCFRVSLLGLPGPGVVGHCGGGRGTLLCGLVGMGSLLSIASVPFGTAGSAVLEALGAAAVLLAAAACAHLFLLPPYLKTQAP